ncbi:hypothetical protein J7E83_10205 [Arthrobacter sp. ISL-48]|uniref:hypothetical protein n=1 Tax=Arthrobacter sp. ISL-48 TaxID=2819110 RepID=UPI001BE5BDB0|nr:hypothetical protein [Arthrobacter sp. ISL-48]MBT2532495.1 hypothetical protein [Arthrobacter sp. ISL-48]
MSFFPGSTHTPRGRRGAGEPDTQALPAADPQGLQEWPSGTGRDDDGGTGSAVVGEDSPLVGAAFGDESAPFHGDPLPAPADEEPFVPRSRYVMGRSTKVMACILLVAAGLFGGSAIQKQIDAGTRGARTNFSNFQGTGTGASTGGGAGAQTPGQGRRNGASGTGGTGSGGAGTAGTATGGAATGATAAPTTGTRQ